MKAIRLVTARNRGRELASVVAGLKSTQNVEMIGVCDLWNANRDRAAKAAADEYGRPRRSFQYVEDLLADKDVDAVIISTADFQHAPLLRLAAEANKDAYCEKPMANDLQEAKAARDAVLSRKLIVQIGTQHRSEPYQAAVRTGERALGRISKVEIVWNYRGPRWRGGPKCGRSAKKTPTGANGCLPSLTAPLIHAPTSNSGFIASSPVEFPING